jgi:fused signal recognition particle receptor
MAFDRYMGPAAASRFCAGVAEIGAQGVDDDEEKPKPGPFRRLFGGAGPWPGSPATDRLPASEDIAPSEPPTEPVSATSPTALQRLFAKAPTTKPPPAPAGGWPARGEAGGAAGSAPTLPKQGWIKRLSSGLTRSSSAIGRGIFDIFAKRKLDAASLDDLEDILIQADLGLGAANRIREAIGRGRYDKGIDPEEVKRLLAEEVERTLSPVAHPLVIDASKKPFVILVVGVNGSGKTTTIGKLAAQLADEGRRVMLVAGDTFRAAAIEQLRIWATRAKAELVAREQGGDPAGLAYDAIAKAKAQGADVVLMDTAGRLQNRAELMSELEKVIRVIKKIDPEAPHATLLVLDATVGQNALSQVEIFGRVAGVTGLVMTKLDGTARGGILVAIADKFKLPVHYIGVGEQMEDLAPFEARDFGRALAGLEG